MEHIDVKSFAQHEHDTGSTVFQIAHLTERIQQLTNHLGTNPKDFSSKRGMMKMVAQRRKLLTYCQEKNQEVYKELIQRLGLRR